MVFVEIFRTTGTEGPFEARDLDHLHPELAACFVNGNGHVPCCEELLLIRDVKC
jgi:hypothetical protein